MAAGDEMTPLERLLNLVGLLLETTRPLTFDEIRETLDAYGQSDPESAKRMFERDKDVLREYGIPLELRETDAWAVEHGYTIPKERYYLPEISFTPEELAALYVAAQTGGTMLGAEQAVRKLLSGADGALLAGLGGGPLAAGSDADAPLLLAAYEAAEGRRRVSFGYRTAIGDTSDRAVDAWAIVFRAGHWYLVGRDVDRDDVRAFRLSRVTSAIEDAGAGGEPPDGFRAADHVRGGPWTPQGEERATIAFTPDVAWLVEGSWSGAEVGATLPDGRVEVSVPLADERELASLVLAYGAGAEALAPPTLREEVVRRLEAFVA